MTFHSGFVALIGRPNVGKSTLLNRVAGRKVAIVSDKPQTTRNRIQAVKTYENAQVVYVDTPGIHKPLYKMNQYMLKTALNSLVGMDLLLVMFDISQPQGSGDLFVLENLPSDGGKKFLVINKTDLVKKDRVAAALTQYSELYKFDEVFPLSALDGYNVAELEKAIIESLPEGSRYFEDESDADPSEYFLASEIIREKLLNITHDELPYSTAVMIDAWEEAKNHERIYAIIYVDKQSQKGIVIGSNGERLKKIGTDARIELEKIFGVKFYLNIWVKVKEKWRDDDRLLREMGLHEE